MRDDVKVVGYLAKLILSDAILYNLLCIHAAARKYQKL